MIIKIGNENNNNENLDLHLKIYLYDVFEQIEQQKIITHTHIYMILSFVWFESSELLYT
jgi:hypothetical protein